MAQDVVLPKLGMAMEEATIIAWTKSVGERLAAGETLAQVETDKAVLEIEAPTAGVLQEIIQPEGAKVAVGTVLARIV